MIHNSSLPRVLCRFNTTIDKELFIKNFQDDFELVFCGSDQEAEAYLKDQRQNVHALVLDQNNLSSVLPSRCKLANRDACVIIIHHHGIELDSIVSLLDNGQVDKCYVKPYNNHLLRSDIFTAYMGLRNQTKALKMSTINELPPAVLIVDDEKIATKFLKKQLEKMGCPCDILIADDAEQALDLFEKNKTRIAIIITDQRMPGMQGNQLLTEIKKLQPSIIRMLTSAYEEVDIALHAVNDGNIFRYIKKPWNASEFNEMIKNALSEFQARMSVLNHQQSDLIKQYDDVTRKRRDSLMRSLSRIVDGFSGVGTFAYFLECLDSIKTTTPNNAAFRASQDTEIESELVLAFSQMMMEIIHGFSVYESNKASQKLLNFAQELVELGARNQPPVCLDVKQLMGSTIDLQLINSLLNLLGSSALDISALEFGSKNSKQFLQTKKGVDITMYKHLLSPQTHVTSQLLQQQCELLTLVMLCRKQNLEFQVMGKELQLGLLLQIPTSLAKQ